MSIRTLVKSRSDSSFTQLCFTCTLIFIAVGFGIVVFARVSFAPQLVCMWSASRGTCGKKELLKLLNAILLFSCTFGIEVLINPGPASLPNHWNTWKKKSGVAFVAYTTAPCFKWFSCTSKSGTVAAGRCPLKTRRPLQRPSRLPTTRRACLQTSLRPPGGTIALPLIHLLPSMFGDDAKRRQRIPQANIASFLSNIMLPFASLSWAKC